MLDGGERALELGKKAVAHGLEDTPVEGRDGGEHDLVEQHARSRASVPDFVALHQPRVADHVTGGDRRQTALDRGLDHGADARCGRRSPEAADGRIRGVASPWLSHGCGC